MAVGSVITVASNASATTSYVSVQKAGRYMFSVEAGAWNAGGAQLHIKSLNGTSIPVSATYFTTNGAIGTILLCAGDYRLSISAATGVYCYLVPID